MSAQADWDQKPPEPHRPYVKTSRTVSTSDYVLSATTVRTHHPQFLTHRIRREDFLHQSITEKIRLKRSKQSDGCISLLTVLYRHHHCCCVSRVRSLCNTDGQRWTDSSYCCPSNKGHYPVQHIHPEVTERPTASFNWNYLWTTRISYFSASVCSEHFREMEIILMR
jgi:hypothetical protein